jgi:hypothetical protein
MSELPAQSAEIAKEYGFSSRYWIKLAAAGGIPGAWQPSGPGGSWVFDRREFRLWAKEIGLKGDLATAKPALKKPKPRPYVRRGDDTVIYAIYSGGHIKIGLSSNAQNRALGFETATPMPVALLATVRGGYVAELKAHKALAPHRIRGEWFRLSSEVRAFVEEMRAAGTAYTSTDIAEAEYRKWLTEQMP